MTIAPSRAEYLNKHIVILLPEYKHNLELTDALLDIDDYLCRHMNKLVITKDLDGLRREVALLTNPKINENL